MIAIAINSNLESGKSMSMMDKLREAARNMTEKNEEVAVPLPTEDEELPTGVEEIVEAEEEEDSKKTEEGELEFEKALYIESLNQKGHTLLITSADSSPEEYFTVIANHVEKNLDSVAYYGFDLNGTMFPDRTDSQTKKLALNLHEAWDLSEALSSEIKERVMTEQPGTKIAVLIKDGHKLFTLENPDNADLYAEMLDNMNTVIEHGAAVGVQVFMEVDAATAEIESRNDFQNVISFN